MPPESYQINQFVAGIVVTIIVLLIAVVFIFMLVSFANKRKRSFMQEKQNLQLLFNEQLLQSQLETQEQTLQLISTELHDNLGALASLIKINLLTIPSDNSTKAAQKLEDTTDLTRQLIADIKSLSVSLSSDRISRKGFYQSLATEVDRINKTGQFNATLSLGEKLPELNNDTAIILYRMVQEVLNNMVKHSKAQDISVELCYKNSCFNVRISDNGIGFNVNEKIQDGDGAGLYNLQKRAGMIGALFSITSSAGKGTSVSIELPA